MPVAEATVNSYLNSGSGREKEADARAFGTDLKLVQQARGFYMPAEKIDGAVDTATALKLAGLDYNVVQEEVFDAKGRLVPGYLRTTRADDDSHTFGINTSRFKPIDNCDAFAVCDEFTRNGYGWEAGGTTQHAGYAWGILAFQDSWSVVGEPMDKKLLFINSHKGESSITLAMTPLRPWCTNALPLTGGFGRSRHGIRHTGDVEAKLKEAIALIGAAGDYWEAFAGLADQLAVGKVPMKRIEKWLSALYPSGTKDGTVGKTTEERRDRVRQMLQVDNLGNHVTATHANGWSFVNAVGEVADWGSTRQRDHMARLCGGNDNPLKNRALAVVTDDLGIGSAN